MKACLMLLWLSFETSSLLGAFLPRLNSLVEFSDNESVICPAVCTTHRLVTLTSCSPHYDMVYEMPVFGSVKHPGCLDSV